MKITSLDDCLAGAYRPEFFADADQARVWNGAQTGIRRTKSPLRWAVPLAAAAIALLAVAAVPPARAAVVDLCGRALGIMDYLGMSPAARPQNTSVEGLIQSGGTAMAVKPAQPGATWVKNVRVCVNEALYDGQFVYVKYTIDARGIQDFTQTKAATDECTLVKYKDYIPQNLFLADQEALPLMECSGPKRGEDGLWVDVAKFDASQAHLSGIVTGTLALSFMDMTEEYNSAGNVGAASPAGFIELQFSFDTAKALQEIKTFNLAGIQHPLSGTVIITNQTSAGDAISLENRTVSLDGCSLVVKSLAVKPSGIDMAIQFIASNDIAWLNFATMSSSLDARLYSNGKEVGSCDSVEADGTAGALIHCSVPMEYAGDIDKLTVVVTLRYFSRWCNVPLELNKPVTRHCLNEVVDEQECTEAIAGGTFDIDLTH